MPIEPPVVSPTSLAEAYAIVGTAPHRPLAGGTDLLVQITGEIGEPPDRVLDLWRLDELRGIAIRGGALELGALTTYTEIRRSALCQEHAPALVEAAATIGAAQIQNRGTLGGNAMNASPAGDTLPVLLALDAELVAGGPRGERTIPAAAFWPAYRRTALRPDELLVRIRIPIVRRSAAALPEGRHATGAGDLEGRARARLARGAGHDRWRDVRLALGSVAATPIRATADGSARSRGTPRTEAAARRASAALAAELEPIDDVRSTAAYRRAVAGRVLERLVRDAGGW